MDGPRLRFCPNLSVSFPLFLSPLPGLIPVLLAIGQSAGPNAVVKHDSSLYGKHMPTRCPLEQSGVKYRVLLSGHVS